MTADYKCYYEAGEHFFRGQSLYFGNNPEFSCQYPYPTNSASQPKFFSGFFYGPGSAAFFSLFALLPYKFSLGLFILFNWWIVFFCLYFAGKILSPGEDSVPQAGVLTAVLALLLAFKPIQSNVDYAQVSLFMLGFLLGFWYLLRKGHDWTAALLVFLGISIKIIPVYVLLYLFVAKDLKSVFFFCLKIVAIGIASVVIALPFRNPLLDYLEFLTALNLKSQVVEVGNFAQSINSVLHRYLTNVTVENEIAPKINIASLSPGSVKIIYAFLVILSTTALFSLAKSFAKNLPQYGYLTFLLFLSAMPLLVPLAWEHYFSVNLITYFFLLSFWRSKIRGMSRLIKGYFVVSLMLILFTSRDVLGVKWSYLLASLSVQSLQSTLTVILLSYIFFKAKSNPDMKQEFRDLFGATTA